MTGIGVDILELRRVEEIKDLHRAAEYFLTPDELEEFEGRSDKAAFFASRFAAKEAVIKAFPKSISPHDFKITKTGDTPTVVFFDPAHARYRALVSLSHSVAYAAGVAAVMEDSPAAV